MRYEQLKKYMRLFIKTIAFHDAEHSGNVPRTRKLAYEIVKLEMNYMR